MTRENAVQAETGAAEATPATSVNTLAAKSNTSTDYEEPQRLAQQQQHSDTQDKFIPTRKVRQLPGAVSPSRVMRNLAVYQV